MKDENFQKAMADAMQQTPSPNAEGPCTRLFEPAVCRVAIEVCAHRGVRTGLDCPPSLLRILPSWHQLGSDPCSTSLHKPARANFERSWNKAGIIMHRVMDEYVPKRMQLDRGDLNIARKS